MPVTALLQRISHPAGPRCILTVGGGQTHKQAALVGEVGQDEPVAKLQMAWGSGQGKTLQGGGKRYVCKQVSMPPLNTAQRNRIGISLV